MKVFCYSKSQNLGAELADGIRPLIGPEDLLLCIGRQALSEALTQPDHGVQIGLLAVGSGAELVELFSLKSILCDIRLVILLEEEDRETIALAHQLRPRYLGLRSQSLGEVKIILEHMLDRIRHSNNGN